MRAMMEMTTKFLIFMMTMYINGFELQSVQIIGIWYIPGEYRSRIVQKDSTIQTFLHSFITFVV